VEIKETENKPEYSKFKDSLKEVISIDEAKKLSKEY